MKQLEADPWEGVSQKYPVSAKFTGRVTNITDYGAFVELEPGVEGLVHVSEMSWTKKNVHPGKIVSTSQEVEVMVLEVDPVKRRISLGLKQCLDNPWATFADRFPVGTLVEGEIKNITEFGLFIGLDTDVDGMVHMSDLDWNRSGEEAMADYTKGQVVKAQVLDVDTEKERISLGIKQLSGDPIAAPADGSTGLKRGSIVTCTVTEITSGGVEVEFGSPAMKSFIRRSDLSRDRADQRPERFAVGDKVDAKILTVDRGSRRVTLSIKALEIAEEADAVAQYGSADAGASLGDILGAALASSSVGKPDAKTETKPEPKAKAAAPAAGDAKAMDERGRLAAPQGDADDLKQIKGVGPAFEKKLHEAGIFHFWQIAALSEAQVSELEEELSFQGRMERDGWKAQAEEFMNQA
jgi:small subunit ribosomal protein S1